MNKLKERKFKHWIMVMHPWFWPASGAPALVAFSYAFYLYKTGAIAEVNWVLGVLAVIGAIVFQAAGNLISEYHDYMSGTDRLEKTGPPRMIVQGYFEPKTVLIYGYIVLLVGILLGIFLLIRTGLPLLFIGIIGVISASIYNRFKKVALSDVVIFITYGLCIALGVTYVMADEMIWNSMLVSIPSGLLITAILHANNIRDVELDKQADIKTQAQILGHEGSLVVYQTLLLTAYLGIAVAVMLGMLHPLTFLVLLSLPFAIKNIKHSKTSSSSNLEPIQFLDLDTAKLLTMFSVLLAAANFIAPFI